METKEDMANLFFPREIKNWEVKRKYVAIFHLFHDVIYSFKKLKL